MVTKVKQHKIKGVLIYTTGDFPYGMAPESLVRQLALGFKYHKINTKVIRLRGKTYNYANDTGIEANDFLFGSRTKSDLTKLIELLSVILLTPFSVFVNFFRHKFDAIILYGVEYFYLIFPFWIACKLTRTKLIRITTDYYRVSTIVPVWWKRPKLFFYNFQFKQFDKYMDGIVSLSSYMADFAKINGVDHRKILIIPHFIDTEGFCRGAASNQDAEKYRIGYCGTVIGVNGIFQLIDAFKTVYHKYPNAELLIIGEPWTAEKEKFNSLIAPFGQVVKVTGRLSASEIPSALLTCNVLVNPRKSSLSADAGFPTKLGEYFSTALPVISTRTGDIRSYFTNMEEIVLVEPDDPEQISDAIIFLIENKERSSIIGKNGFRWAKEHLDYKANTQKILNFIMQ